MWHSSLLRKKLENIIWEKNGLFEHFIIFEASERLKGVEELLVYDQKSLKVNVTMGILLVKECSNLDPV